MYTENLKNAYVQNTYNMFALQPYYMVAIVVLCVSHLCYRSVGQYFYLSFPVFPANNTRLMTHHLGDCHMLSAGTLLSDKQEVADALLCMYHTHTQTKHPSSYLTWDCYPGKRAVWHEGIDTYTPHSFRSGSTLGS